MRNDSLEKKKKTERPELVKDSVDNNNNAFLTIAKAITGSHIY